MANYVIGDVQGCLDSLKRLLKKIKFSESEDTLWFAGDLVNRGPKSLKSLRYIKNLGKSARVVLGNHDLHLLALAAGHGRQHKSDTIADIIQAPDCEELINWLRQQPLMWQMPNKSDGTPRYLVHAGLLPSWSFEKALMLAEEAQLALMADDWKDFVAVMYGNKPANWADTLRGADRLRVIINVFTRLRMVYTDTGDMEFAYKDSPSEAPQGIQPWYEMPTERNKGQIFFGHWSTLGQIELNEHICLDTGCVWGGSLTAYRLEDEAIFTQQAVD